ncbi:tRNA preQ1(34) S-adenosylmethionine ribosyltransferase-isomerase QueA [Oscillospiraceae bacterium HV4-5-C5C]|nr:tRNA preQ1(34) S-adenosylmethionine ribosyltransferase-isomerase QueA [Oscillospiraceae bacterium HV4-5-C5C]
MKKSEFYYELPPELIAQHPLPERDQCRLLHLDSQGHYEDLHFPDVTHLLRRGDLLVLNDTRVMPARLIGEKTDSHIAVELLLLRRLEGDDWEVMVRPGRRLKPGARVSFLDGKITADIEDLLPEGCRKARFHYNGIWEERLAEAGTMPLPPYIHEQLEDPEQYQTVYAANNGSAAAPTAGLHFTRTLLEQLEQQGVELCYVTLHVGLGTFRPVKEENIEDHPMHSEYFEVSAKAATQLNAALQAADRRIIAVGTTDCRLLETIVPAQGEVKACSGWTDIFIYPGYQFKAVDALITNFHLPESTLVMLVSALSRKDWILAAYQHAIEERYRFFSFGDAMFIEKSDKGGAAN